MALLEADEILTIDCENYQAVLRLSDIYEDVNISEATFLITNKRTIMQSILFEEAKQNLDSLCQKSCQDHEPYIIHRADNNHVVVLSLDDFNSWQETLYLLSNPANAERLLHSLKSARAGNIIEHELIEE